MFPISNSIVKVIELILFDPEKAYIITLFLIRVRIEDNKLIKGLIFQSSIVKVIELILFDPEKLTLLPHFQ